MGLGDNLMATGFARGAAARGKRVAFGDGKRILWDHFSPEIFAGNPNIAPPGSEGASDLDWVPFYRGHRIYNTLDAPNYKWIWTYEFEPTPGEVFFTAEERSFASRFGQGFILLEPNVPQQKSVAPNKQWPLERYVAVANRLMREGHEVKQFYYAGSYQIKGVAQIKTATFRQALAVLARASTYIGAEGGLHHGAAAVGIPAVVIFGGFIPPEVTGYPTHKNLTGGAVACGSLARCDHCKAALEAISVKDVMGAVEECLLIGPKEASSAALPASTISASMA